MLKGFQRLKGHVCNSLISYRFPRHNVLDFILKELQVQNRVDLLDCSFPVNTSIYQDKSVRRTLQTNLNESQIRKKLKMNKHHHFEEQISFQLVQNNKQKVKLDI